MASSSIPAERLRIVERDRFLRDLQAQGDVIARQLTEELDLPEGTDVVYVMDAPTD